MSCKEVGTLHYFSFSSSSLSIFKYFQLNEKIESFE